MAGYYQLSRTNDDLYSFSLHAEDGVILLTGESYFSKYSVLNAIEDCRDHCAFDFHYLHLISDCGRPYFALVAQTGKVIGTSELYVNAFAREVGIRALRMAAPSRNIKIL